MSTKLAVKRSAIKFKTNGNVSLENTSLANATSAEIAQSLSKDAPSIKATDITVSPQGKVVVSNAEFSKKVIDTPMDGDINIWKCNEKGCQQK